MKIAIASSAFLIAFAVSAVGQTTDPDPVGFCSAGTSAAACIASFPSGSNETIGIGTSSFVMVKNGSGTSASPWYLLIALPNYTGSAPVLTQTSGTPTFNSPTVANAGDWTSSSSKDLYQFAAQTVSGVGDTNASMNTTNLFGSTEISALGAAPSFFDVFVYTFSPAFDSNVAYGFSVGGTGLPIGTFLANSGGSQPFSTPFTTAGLVNGPGCTPQTCTGTGGGGTVPEPSSVLLFGTLSLIVVGTIRKKVRL